MRSPSTSLPSRATANLRPGLLHMDGLHQRSDPGRLQPSISSSASRISRGSQRFLRRRRLQSVLVCAPTFSSRHPPAPSVDEFPIPRVTGSTSSGIATTRRCPASPNEGSRTAGRRDRAERGVHQVQISWTAPASLGLTPITQEPNSSLPSLRFGYSRAAATLGSSCRRRDCGQGRRLRGRRNGWRRWRPGRAGDGHG